MSTSLASTGSERLRRESTSREHRVVTGRGFILLICAAALLAACSGSTGSSSTPKGGFNAGVGKVANPSEQKGGTLRFANSGDWDSLDPGGTYLAYSWDFSRLFGRSLVTFATAPGAQGATLVPDLATSLGKPSADLKTWTYTLRSGVKFDTGETVTSKDVKYAVARSLDKTVLPGGPLHFNNFLALGGYTGPYKNKNLDAFTAISTPDDKTLIFHLRTPMANFDYLAMLPQTIPVPQKADTGTRYKNHVVATGPYKFASVQLGKSFVLVRNPEWDQSTDPLRKALPDRIEVALNVNPNDRDSRLLAGDVDVDINGEGVGPAAQGRILGDASLKARADNPARPAQYYTAINPDVPPLDNVHCRRAVEYAVDRSAYQRAFGGSIGADIATSLMPPVIRGATKFDAYPTKDAQGDVDKARSELTACGRPQGFSTSISFASSNIKSKAAVEAQQAALARIGIQLSIKPFADGDYQSRYAGNPIFAKKNGLGLMMNGLIADWPDPYGLLEVAVDSRQIKQTGGNYNLGIKEPVIDALIDKSLSEPDETARAGIWAQIDRKIQEDALAVPGVWPKGLYYRPPTLTNAYITNAYGMYDYVALGTTRK